TMAASVAGLCGMGVLAQAMIWLGIPEPPAWKLILYMLSIGMFGAGLGMLYTPLLVDRMQLTYPSGYAGANILRALTDRTLLRRSIGKLGGGTSAGFLTSLGVSSISVFTHVGLSEALVKAVEKSGFQPSTVGAGMIVGARIAIPALVVGLIGRWQTPHLMK